MIPSKDFHNKYAKCVRTFCKSVPPTLQVTTDELDTYFRSCALYLWAHREQLDDIFNGINRLYTDSQVKFSRQEIEDQINFYRANPSQAVSVPDFFLRMFQFDKDSDTDNSRKFIDVQGKVLAMCAQYVQPTSILDGRRVEWMCEQLTIICDQAAIGLDDTQEELDSKYLKTMEKDAEEEVKEIMDSLEELFAPRSDNE